MSGQAKKYAPRHTKVVTRKSLHVRRLTVLASEAPDAPAFYWRPRTRGDCARVPRPCPYVGCRYHLYLDVLHNGNLRLNFPDREPDEIPETCALDVAERGSHSLDQTMGFLNVTRERIRQIERVGMDRLLEDDAVRQHALELDDGVTMSSDDEDQADSEATEDDDERDDD